MNRIINKANDNIIKILILVVVLSFIKGIMYLVTLIDLERNIIINKPLYNKVKESIDIILDTILFLFSIFILFFRQNNSTILIFLAVLFLFKGFFQYFLYLKLYKYTNIQDESINTMQKIKNINSFITNIFLLFASSYILVTIFTNNTILI